MNEYTSIACCARTHFFVLLTLYFPCFISRNIYNIDYQHYKTIKILKIIWLLKKICLTLHSK